MKNIEIERGFVEKVEPIFAKAINVSLLLLLLLRRTSESSESEIEKWGNEYADELKTQKAFAESLDEASVKKV